MYKSYSDIAERAKSDQAFKEGLQAARDVCIAHDTGKLDDCPPRMLGVYLENLANGRLP